MSLAADTSAQVLSAAQPIGAQYIVRGLNFQYQLPGGVYYVGGDLSGTVHGVSTRYFMAC